MEIPNHQQMPTVLLLSFVGGFVDAYTYLHYGILANTQTGNIIILGTRLASGDWINAEIAAMPLLLFCIGVIVRTGISKFTGEDNVKPILAFEIIMLFLIGLIAPSLPGVLVFSLVAFLCGVQVSAFKKVHNSLFASTMCTGNTRTAVELLSDFFFNGNKESGKSGLRLLSILAVFCFGGFIGFHLVRLLDFKSIWVCCVALMAAYILQIPQKLSTKVSNTAQNASW